MQTKVPKLNLPGTLIPMATANTMLIVGSSKDHCDCEFPLQYFLVIAGCIGLCLIVMDVLAQYVIKWVLQDNKITNIEQKVLTCMKIAGFVLAFVQLAALIAGSVLVFANYPYVTYEKPMNCGSLKRMRIIPEAGHQVYCDYAMYMFSFCLVTMTWAFLLLGLCCFAYIFYGLRKLAEERSEKCTTLF